MNKFLLLFLGAMAGAYYAKHNQPKVQLPGPDGDITLITDGDITPGGV